MKLLLSQLLLWVLFAQGAVLAQSTYMVTDAAIEHSLLVDCPVDTVWWKWSTGEGLLTFLGADNKIELIPGGAYEIYFLPDAPYGQKGGEGSRVLSYLPGRMISFTWSAPPYHETVRNHPHKTWVVVEFSETPDGKTLVELTHLGWLEGEDWDAVYAYFDKAWVSVLQSLANSCNED